MVIKIANKSDIQEIYEVINDAAMAYKGKIPTDRWHEPYMTKEELQEQIEDGVVFSCYIEKGKIIGVMGFQDKNEVDLIRHAYVRTSQREKGIGSLLLKEIIEGTKKPVLIGTWKDADWAIRFYEKHGFHLVTEEEKNVLLKKYWKIPERQVETSVVLADGRYKEHNF
jgi:N-acetylglutamate synthase-like GNAT family acetyltransferase